MNEVKLTAGPSTVKLFPEGLKKHTVILACVHEGEKHLVLLQEKHTQNKNIIYFDGRRDIFWSLDKVPLDSVHYNWVNRREVKDPLLKWYSRDGELLQALRHMEAAGLCNNCVAPFTKLVTEMLV